MFMTLLCGSMMSPSYISSASSATAGSASRSWCAICACWSSSEPTTGGLERRDGWRSRECDYTNDRRQLPSKSSTSLRGKCSVTHPTTTIVWADCNMPRQAKATARKPISFFELLLSSGVNTWDSHRRRASMNCIGGRLLYIMLIPSYQKYVNRMFCGNALVAITFLKIDSSQLRFRRIRRADFLSSSGATVGEGLGGCIPPLPPLSFRTIPPVLPNQRREVQGGRWWLRHCFPYTSHK